MAANEISSAVFAFSMTTVAGSLGSLGSLDFCSLVAFVFSPFGFSSFGLSLDNFS